MNKPKITLATLAEATAQEVFDQVVEHLFTQGVPSKGEGIGGGCFYRFGNLKCAAGCLISDEEYIPEMDNPADGGDSTWIALISTNVVPSTQHNDLIISLQDVHDHNMVKFWKDKLVTIADSYNLKWNFK